jgi:hypothetical protein
VIRDPEKTYFGSRIHGSKRHRIPEPGSGSATLDGRSKNRTQEKEKQKKKREETEKQQNNIEEMEKQEQKIHTVEDMRETRTQQRTDGEQEQNIRRGDGRNKNTEKNRQKHKEKT